MKYKNNNNWQFSIAGNGFIFPFNCVFVEWRKLLRTRFRSVSTTKQVFFLSFYRFWIGLAWEWLSMESFESNWIYAICGSLIILFHLTILSMADRECAKSFSRDGGGLRHLNYAMAINCSSNLQKMNNAIKECTKKYHRRFPVSR